MVHRKTFMFNLIALLLGTLLGYILNQSFVQTPEISEQITSLSSLIGKDIFIGSIYLIALF